MNYNSFYYPYKRAKLNFALFLCHNIMGTNIFTTFEPTKTKNNYGI
jgi:hypothetical protein